MSTATAYEPVTTGASAEKTAAGTGSASPPQKAGLWSRITNKAPFLGTKTGLAVTIVAILVIIGGGLAGLAALRNRNGNDGSSGAGGSAGTTSSNVISSDAHFYGQSPPVYPSRGSIPPFSPLLGGSVWLTV